MGCICDLLYRDDCCILVIAAFVMVCIGDGLYLVMVVVSGDGCCILVMGCIW